MGNTSATGGYLPSAPPLPIDDAALDAVLQSLVVGVTGLDGTMVRPRWQATVPKEPEVGVNWCAIGVATSDVDAGPWIAFDPVKFIGLYWRHEEFEVLASFYGPASKTNAALLRDGLGIVQNLEALLPYAMRAIDNGPIRAVPDLVNQQWRKRQDMLVRFRRKIERTYAITTITTAQIVIEDDTVIRDVIFVPPFATPSYSPQAGTFVGSVTVTVVADAAAIVHYTLDGSLPTPASPVYEGPLTFTTSTTLSALAAGVGDFVSSVAVATYTII